MTLLSPLQMLSLLQSFALALLVQENMVAILENRFLLTHPGVVTESKAMQITALVSGQGQKQPYASFLLLPHQIPFTHTQSQALLSTPFFSFFLLV